MQCCHLVAQQVYWWSCLNKIRFPAQLFDPNAWIWSFVDFVTLPYLLVDVFRTLMIFLLPSIFSQLYLLYACIPFSTLICQFHLAAEQSNCIILVSDAFFDICYLSLNCISNIFYFCLYCVIRSKSYPSLQNKSWVSDKLIHSLIWLRLTFQKRIYYIHRCILCVHKCS